MNHINKLVHDLKGNVSNIDGLVMLAQLETKDKKVQYYLDLIAQCKNEMFSLISETLKAHKVSSFLISDVVKEVLDQVLRLDPHLVQTDFVTNSEVLFKSKRNLINSLIYNLISNSVRHNTSSTPKLYIRLHTNPGYCFLHIEDNGPGLPEERIDFQHVDITSWEGTGLGLCKEIVSELKGIMVASNRSRLGGVKYSLTLPNTK